MIVFSLPNSTGFPVRNLNFYCVAYVTRPRWSSCFVMLWKKFQRMLKGSALSSMNIDH